MTSRNEINTTKFLVKPNVETTRYFTPSDPSEDIWRELDKKENITDHNADMTTINNNITNINTNITNIDSRVTTNETNITNINNDITTINNNITTINTNITNIDSRVTTNETNITNIDSQVTTNTTNITQNTTDITNIKNQLNNLDTGTKFEGEYYAQFFLNNDYTMAVLNYDKGRLLYYREDTYILYCVLNDKSYDNLLRTTTKDLTLPVYVKQFSRTGSKINLFKIKTYKIESAVNNNYRRVIDLESVTVPTGIQIINFELIGAPSLKFFNLMEGLTSITINGNLGNNAPSEIETLTIPSTVTYCKLEYIRFRKLKFKANHNDTIELHLDNIAIFEKLTVMRSHIVPVGSSGSTLSTLPEATPPVILKCHKEFISAMITTNGSLGYANSSNLQSTTTLIITCVAEEGAPTSTNNIAFKRLINMTPFLKNQFTNITVNSVFE